MPGGNQVPFLLIDNRQGELTAAHLPDGFLRPAGAGDVTALEEVEGQSAQDQNVGHKHQEGVDLPRSIA